MTDLVNTVTDTATSTIDRFISAFEAIADSFISRVKLMWDGDLDDPDNPVKPHKLALILGISFVALTSPLWLPIIPTVAGFIVTVAKAILTWIKRIISSIMDLSGKLFQKSIGRLIK